jgi:L-2-hydroxyglutarate oxidase
MERWDVLIVGGGVLGTSLAYWLGARHGGRVAVVEREATAAAHASGRNTGVVHRPFYLDPAKAGLFARVAQVSYGVWKRYAAARALPWGEVGTLKVALAPDEVPSLERNVGYARANGMADSEFALLDAAGVAALEPNVRCAGGLLVKTDTVVDYRALTEAVKADAQALGVVFYSLAEVRRIERKADHLVLRTQNAWERLETRYLVNCAGGGALDIARLLGVGGEYADLHFRGEYWVLGKRASPLVGRNVYTVPKSPDLPFLDPHWIVRPDGQREVGPNAVPVPRLDSYGDLARTLPDWPGKFLEAPVSNKARFTFSRTFLTLSAREMLSSLSRHEMMRRVQQFVPRLRESDLVRRGIAGIRTPVIDRKGRMVKEAIELAGPMSYHVLNYNSPGATGAPAYTAYLVDRLAARGDLDHLKREEKAAPGWAWKEVAGPMGLAA